MAQRQAYAAHAQKWVGLSRSRQAGKRLVTASVEGADRHGPARGPIEQPAIDRILFVLIRKAAASLKQEFGPNQADTVAVSRIERLKLRGTGDVDQHRNLLARCRDSRAENVGIAVLTSLYLRGATPIKHPSG